MIHCNKSELLNNVFNIHVLHKFIFSGLDNIRERLRRLKVALKYDEHIKFIQKSICKVSYIYIDFLYIFL